MGTRSTRNNRLFLAIGAGVLSAGPVTAVHAQQAGSRAALDEIIVTARKSEERLQDVPISISAYTGAELQSAGIKDIVDVAAATPGFSFLSGFGRTGSGEGGGASSRPAIRGMSNILGAPNASFFVDGIYFSSNIASLQLDNLERVEVIRGPQSALFGRQTFAGAINFITRQPDEEFRGQVNATAGQFGRYDLSGFVSGPLIPGLLFGEINGRYYDFGGDYRNANTGKRDINAQHTRNIGGKLRLTPGENLDITLNVAYSYDQDLGYASTRYLAEDLNCLLPTIVGATVPPPFFPPPGTPISSTRTRGWLCGSLPVPEEVAFDNDGLRALGHYGLRRETLRSDLSVNYDFGNDWSVTWISAFNRSWNVNGFDNDLGIRGIRNLTVGRTGREDRSQELRLLSPRDARLRGMFGVYYYDLDDRPGYNVITALTPALIAAGVQLGQRNRFDEGSGVTNTAAFALVEYDVTDRLTMSAEARQQRDKIVAVQTLDGGNTDLTPFANRREATFSKFLPRVTGRFTVSDDMNLYASWAKGNKPGGFNNFPANAQPQFRDAWAARGLETIDEENVTAIELGVKGTFADNRYSYNVAIFNLDWDAQTLTRAEPYQTTAGAFTTTPFLINAGTSRIRGVEMELTGAPTDWLNFRATWSYTQPIFRDFYDEELEALFDTDGRTSFLPPDFVQPNPADVDGPLGQARGQTIPQTSRQQATLSVTLRRDLTPEWSGFFRNDFNYEGKRFVQTDNLLQADANKKWNLRLGAESDKLTLSLYVNNVLDDDTPVVGTRLFTFDRFLLVPNVFGTGNQFTFYRGFLASLPRKREVGLTANYRF